MKMSTNYKLEREIWKSLKLIFKIEPIEDIIIKYSKPTLLETMLEHKHLFRCYSPYENDNGEMYSSLTLFVGNRRYPDALDIDYRDNGVFLLTSDTGFDTIYFLINNDNVNEVVDYVINDENLDKRKMDHQKILMLIKYINSY